LHKEDIASDKLKALLRSNSVVEVDAKNFRMVDALCRKVGRGESEAIVVAIEHSSDFVILDDHVARTEARRIGLNVKGTLGIIKRLMEFRVKRGIFDQIFKL
jgi:predicted nucleic acid-binding protein